MGSFSITFSACVPYKNRTEDQISNQHTKQLRLIMELAHRDSLSVGNGEIK